MSLHKAAASTASGSHELHSRMCKKVADLTRVIDKLFKEFYEQSGALRSLQKKYRQQSKENDSLVMEKANLADEVVTCKNELQRSNQHFKELVNCLKVQLADCQKDKDIALGEVDDLQQSLMETLKELEELKAANNKLLMESNNDCISCEDHVESIESLKQQLELNSAHCIELRKEKDGLHTRLNELQSQYERTNDECQQLREEIGTSEERIDALQSEKCNLQLKITHLLKELQELRTITAKREKVMSDSPIPAPNRRKEYWLQTRSKVGVHNIA